MSEYRVNLDVFAGPLDLLLYLVRKEEVDIYDIPIARVTAQYIAYIELLKGLDIDLAGDFLVMAATLMEIKSAMLLPSADESQPEDGRIEDPRAELVRQLLEYKRFKDAANLLGDSAQVRQQRYTRPASILERLKPTQEPEVDLDQVSIWTLLEAFDGIMKATGQMAGYGHIKDDTPIDLYQIEVLHRLQVEGAMTLERIFEGRKDRLGMIGLFLGMLELIRNRLIWAEQPEANGPILLKALTREPAEQAVQKAIYAEHPEEEGEDDLAAEAQELKMLEENAYSTSPDDDDDLDDDMRRELSQIKEVEVIDTGGSADARPRIVEAADGAAEKTDAPKPAKPRIAIVDIGSASAEHSARSKIETVEKNVPSEQEF